MLTKTRSQYTELLPDDRMHTECDTTASMSLSPSITQTLTLTQETNASPKVGLPMSGKLGVLGMPSLLTVVNSISFCLHTRSVHMCTVGDRQHNICITDQVKYLQATLGHSKALLPSIPSSTTVIARCSLLLPSHCSLTPAADGRGHRSRTGG